MIATCIQVDGEWGYRKSYGIGTKLKHFNKSYSILYKMHKKKYLLLLHIYVIQTFFHT